MKTQKALKAYVNHGRWLVTCPQCGGAEIVKVNQPFHCLGQVNVGFHGETTACGCVMDVEWPDEKLAIEAVLIKRKLEHRNWIFGETVEMLKAENIQQGIV